MSKTCTVCGKRAYSDYCVQHKPRKRIAQRGQRTIEYEEWRDTVAIPYLERIYGHTCAIVGCPNQNLDVAHVQGRGSHPGLKMNVRNVRWLCRPHHRLETDNKLMEV